jgi:Family of unknown function (DUF5771)
MDGGRGTCPPGQIMRKGYRRRKSGTYVKPSCIKDRGAPGKGPKLFNVTHPGILTNMGYHTYESMGLRHSAIERAVKKSGYAEIFKALNNLRLWNKRVNPELSFKASRDINYLRNDLCKYSLEGCDRRRSSGRRRSRRRSSGRRRSRRRSSGRRRSRRRSSGRRRR